MKGSVLAVVAIQFSVHLLIQVQSQDFQFSGEDLEADIFSAGENQTIYTDVSLAGEKNCTVDWDVNEKIYPQLKQIMRSFKKLSDCLESCGNDSDCSGVEFDFSNQICLRKNCDPLDQSNGNTYEENSNMTMILNHITAYKCGKNGCCEEDSSGRMANTGCTNSGFCPSQTHRFIEWPTIAAGSRSVQPCPNRSNSSGEGLAKWLCGRNPAEWVGHPDLSDCRSQVFDDVKREMETMKGRLTPESMSNLVNSVLTISTQEDLLGGDLTSLMNVTGDVLKEIQSLLNNTDGELRKSLIQNLSRAFLDINSNLLERNLTATWLDLPEKAQTETADRIMWAVEEGGKVFANAFEANQSLDMIVANNIVLEVRNFPKIGDEYGNLTLVFPSSTDDSHDTEEPAPWFQSAGWIAIPEANFEHRNHTSDPTRIVFSFFNDLEKWLQPSNTSSTKMEIHPRSSRQRLINSKIISASVVNADSSKRYELKEPVKYVLKHNQIESVSDPVCVFWNNYDEAIEGGWSSDGCRLVNSNITHTTCECDHLTNFAVLMSVTAHKMSAIHRFSLSMITYIGCGISMICQALAFVTFNIFKNLQSDLNTVHKHLVLNLFVAQLIFLLGISLTSKPILCSIVAGSLHFFFLTAFAWMCLEGVQLYLMLVKVFEAKRSLVKWYYAAAYGAPALIVAATAAIAHDGYGTHDHCWLSVDNGVIWAFVGPVAAILAMNVVMLCIALCTIFRSSGTSAAHMKQHKTTVENIGSCIKGAFVLMILLGTTWVFGLFYINQHSIFMAYLFTIFNSLQGFFIFVFHCLLKEKVQKEYKRWIQNHHWLPVGIRIRFGGVGASPTVSSAAVGYSISSGIKKLSFDGNMPYKVSDQTTGCLTSDPNLTEGAKHRDPDETVGTSSNGQEQIFAAIQLKEETASLKSSGMNPDGPSTALNLDKCIIHDNKDQPLEITTLEQGE